MLNAIKEKISLLLLIGGINVFPQIENIPVEHEVYNFLQRMYVNGILNDYDDVILPLSRKQIHSAILDIHLNKQKLNSIDQKILDRISLKLGFHDSIEVVQFFDRFPDRFLSNLIEEKEKHLYFYGDSIINFYADPVFEYKFIYSDINKKGSSILNFGGRIRGSYQDWFGYYIQATNGSVFGDRSTASIDKRIKQSFSFNDTKINFFDNTTGYFRIEKGIMSAQLGRERILWGVGEINKLVLSDNPPVFDFIRFGLKYKTIRYDFLHGWLVMQPEFLKISNDISKEKRSKYIAISRLGINPNPDISLGVSQTVIYSNRAFEAAYLNPFLFWESAQRSLNDLDNSFLTFDGRYRVTNGLMINSTAIFDDINFGRLFKGEWAGYNNGFAWQAGVSVTSPVIFENTIVDIEYLQLRPYIFSHWGFQESLTYTNNGYLLGSDLNPNSTLFSLKILYCLNERIKLSLNYFHSLHGNNEYDSVGIRTRNVGGNVFEYYTSNDSRFAYLLDGVRETENRFGLGIIWEFIPGVIFKFEWFHSKNSFLSSKNYDAFFTSVKLDLE